MLVNCDTSQLRSFNAPRWYYQADGVFLSEVALRNDAIPPNIRHIGRLIRSDAASVAGCSEPAAFGRIGRYRTAWTAKITRPVKSAAKNHVGQEMPAGDQPRDRDQGQINGNAGERDIAPGDGSITAGAASQVADETSPETNEQLQSQFAARVHQVLIR